MALNRISSQYKRSDPLSAPCHEPSPARTAGLFSSRVPACIILLGGALSTRRCRFPCGDYIRSYSFVFSYARTYVCVSHASPHYSCYLCRVSNMENNRYQRNSRNVPEGWEENRQWLENIHLEWSPEAWEEMRGRLEVLSLPELVKVANEVGIVFEGGNENLKDAKHATAREQLILVLDESKKDDLLQAYEKVIQRRLM